MGEKKLRRERFFRQHPYCCFCGGTAIATTEDHQPARTLFRGRAWPEGFVFPACERCNAVSAPSEKLVSLLIHGEAASDDRGSYQRLVTSIRREHPQLIGSMLPSGSNEIRRILKRKGIPRPGGLTFSDIPIVKLDQNFWKIHFQVFALKLLLALHYQCFGVPLSKAGRVEHWINTNVDFAANQFPKQVIELARNVALPSRQKSMLHDQFSIRWDIIPQSATGLFVMQFHHRLLVSGVTTETPDSFSRENMERMLSPWDWSS